MAPEDLLQYDLDQEEPIEQEYPSDSVVLKKELSKPIPDQLGPIKVKLNPIDFGKNILGLTEKPEEQAKEAPSLVNNYNTNINNVDNSNRAVNTANNLSDSNSTTSSELTDSYVSNFLTNIGNTFGKEYLNDSPTSNNLEVPLIRSEPLSKKAKSKTEAEKPVVAEKFNDNLSLVNLLTQESKSNSTNLTTSDLTSIVNDLNIITNKFENTQIDSTVTNKALSNNTSNERTTNSAVSNNTLNERNTNSAVSSDNSSISDSNRSYQIQTQSSSPTVKTSKLAETSSIKSALEPDKSLANHVETLSKVLPESITNLSTNVTNSLSQPANSNTSVTNQGANIDNSSNTTVNQELANQKKSASDLEADKNKMTIDLSQTEFYLQAIYQALASGKLKVQLSY